MKIKQNNKLKMTKTTLACLQHANNAPLWQGIAGFEEAVADTEELVNLILERSLKQSERTGSSAEKKAAKETLTNLAFAVCSGLKAFASATSNRKLAAQADFSHSDLTRGREADLVNRCQSILALGTENADALAAKFNVTATDLKALKAAFAEFTELQPTPRQSRAASAAATADLEKLFAQLDEALKSRLDQLMVKFQRSNPAFYNEYQTARFIVSDSAPRETKAAKEDDSVAMLKAA
jgi:hypothetical protein